LKYYFNIIDFCYLTSRLGKIWSLFVKKRTFIPINEFSNYVENFNFAQMRICFLKINIDIRKN